MNECIKHFVFGMKSSEFGYNALFIMSIMGQRDTGTVANYVEG